jgi:hypothetical protein
LSARLGEATVRAYGVRRGGAGVAVVSGGASVADSCLVQLGEHALRARGWGERGIGEKRNEARTIHFPLISGIGG